jgi:hypothetical protein
VVNLLNDAIDTVRPRSSHAETFAMTETRAISRWQQSALERRSVPALPRPGSRARRPRENFRDGASPSLDSHG